MTTKNDLLNELQLKQVDNLEEIIMFKHFFVDISYSDENELIVYPVTKKANLTHNLLNLYGTHWRYVVDTQNTQDISRNGGDISIVLYNISKGKKVDKFACYAFTKKYLDANKSLWIFMPNTPGWNYHQKILVPMFKSDMIDYQRKKQAAAQKIGST